LPTNLPNLLNQLGSKILLRFLFVLVKREAGFDCSSIWYSPIHVRQMPESLPKENLLHKRLVDGNSATLRLALKELWFARALSLAPKVIFVVF
jgi:hypothetical protein